jgi:hypothetical protein
MLASLKVLILGDLYMYNCVLWSGAHLPLPKMDSATLERNGTWEPLFVSSGEVPLLWWFLIDRFNCFWLDNGVPIIVVDRAKALARADARFNKLEGMLLPRQCEAWLEFRERLCACPGEIINIQLFGLWREKFSSCANHFDTYVDTYLLPLEKNHYGSHAQKQQKRILLTEHFAKAGSELTRLYGEPLSPLKEHY